MLSGYVIPDVAQRNLTLVGRYYTKYFGNSGHSKRTADFSTRAEWETWDMQGYDNESCMVCRVGAGVFSGTCSISQAEELMIPGSVS